MLVLGLAVVLAADVYLSAGPSFACRFPSAGRWAPGITARAVSSGGLRRCYLVYVPPGFDPQRATPVVIAPSRLCR